MRRILPLFFIWLLMLALPLQGFAAASMPYCGSVLGHKSTESQNLLLPHQHLTSTYEEVDDTPTKAVSIIGDSSTIQKIGEIGSAASSTNHEHHHGEKSSSGAHKCGVCASCCNLIDITNLPTLHVGQITFEAQFVEPIALMYAAPLRRHEKPPRA